MFLNPQRIEEPDVDTDISKLHRSKAIQYLKARYGEEYVCQIATYGQYKLKNTIKAVLSAERGFTADYQNSITKQIPDMLDGNPVTLKLLEDIESDDSGKYENLTDRELAQAKGCLAMLRELFVEHKDVELAVQKVCGAISSIGIHAGGVVISSKPLHEHIPLMKGGAAAVLNVCQTNMDGIHFMHGLKIDALGLKTLSQIRYCMDISDVLEEWLDDEDTSEEDVYRFLREGNTVNVFQMAKHMPTSMIRDFFVNSLAGLNAVNAGNRPGPLAKGEDGKSMVDRYAEAVTSGHIISIHPLIDPILQETNGQLWYQEQLQKIGQVMAGYSLGNADLRIRKVVAKKLKKKIPEIRNEFVYGKKSLYDKDGNVTGVSDEDSPYCIGAVRNGFDEALALKIFKDMEAFAAYCFNKSHSAAYGFIAYRTAWLSYHYPVEWSIACMTLDTIDGKQDNVIATLNNCKKRGIKVLPPDINESESGFSVAKLDDGTKGIRYGLLGIKGVGNGVLDLTKKLIEKDGKFSSFQDFLERTVNNKTNFTLRELCLEDETLHSKSTDKKGNPTVKISNPFAKRNIIPLILAGAFDSLEPNRHKTLNEYIDFRGAKGEEAEKKAEEDYLLKDKLQYEFDLLGYYVSQHPLDGPAFPYVDLDMVADNSNVEVAGILKSCVTSKTKKGDKFYKLKIELKDGKEMAVNVFKNVYEKNPNCVKGLASKKAKEGKEIIVVKGKVSLQWNNINATNILRILSKAEELEDDIIPEPEEGIPNLSIPTKESPMDQDILQTVG